MISLSASRSARNVAVTLVDPVAAPFRSYSTTKPRPYFSAAALAALRT